MSRLLILTGVVCLLGFGVFAHINSEQLGIVIPSLQELEHRAEVASDQLGDKFVSMWHDFLARS